MKRILLLSLSFLLLLGCFDFNAVSASTPAAELYIYNEDGTEKHINDYEDLSSAIKAMNENTAVGAHFLIKINQTVKLPASSNADKTIKNPAVIGERTLTIDGQGNGILELVAHNGIIVGEAGTKIVNLNLKNLTIKHTSTGSAVQYMCPGTLNIDNCRLEVTGPSASNNYAVINANTNAGVKVTMNVSNTDISVSRPSTAGGATIFRTGNNANEVDINIDGCNIISSANGVDGILVFASVDSDISITDTNIDVNNAYSITTGNNAGETGLTLGRTNFAQNGVTVYEKNTAIDPNGNFRTPTLFTAYTGIGGFNTFPELIITEAHLNSINIDSSVGPIDSENTTSKKWSEMDWWGTGHSNSIGELSGEFFRYIEIYNSSERPIDIYDYKIVVDGDANALGTQMRSIDISAGARIGSVENAESAVIEPGEIAVIWLYNQIDRDLSATFDNFRGYYGWRYDGSNTELEAIGATPAARDTYLTVDLSQTVIVAVDDIMGADTVASTKLGNFRENSIYYGINAKSTTLEEDHNSWTSWVLFEHYNNSYSEDSMLFDANQSDQSTFNFLYGLDASADIREGRRLNETRPTYNCNPGLLQSIQKLNFPHSGVSGSAPDITITEINNYSNGKYDYIEVANISSGPINIYDYCILGRYNIINVGGSDFSIHWFDRVNYIIPGDVGDIQSYTNTKSAELPDYTGEDRTVVYSNPDYANGVIEKGETAVIWMYDIECYQAAGAKTSEAQLEEFKAYFGEGDTSKIFAMSGFRNEYGEHNQSIGLSNASCEIYGIAKLENFSRSEEIASETESGTKCNTYAEILKETITYQNTEKTRNGFSILDCDCVVFMYSSMINGNGKDNATLGMNVAYQYAASYVNGAALRFAGFLSTLRQDNGGTVINESWNAAPTGLTSSQSALVKTFIKDDSFSVTYNPNGGAGEPVTQLAYADLPIVLPGEIFEREGKRLIGWSAVPNASAEYYTTGASLSVSADMILYAVWADKPPGPSYIVTIPDLITINENGSGEVIISAELSNFANGDRLDLSIETDNGLLELAHSEISEYKLAYRINSYQGDIGEVSCNGIAATFTNADSNDVSLGIEVMDLPGYAGIYSDSITFKLTFTES